MRLMHVSLASVFTEGLTYQDNMLAEQNRRDGHEVCVVADCLMYKDGVIVKTDPCDRIIEGGIRLIRLPLFNFGIDCLTNRLRYAPRLRKILDDFKPDVVLYHGVIGLGLWTVGQYRKSNTGVKLYVDSHEDFNNSGRNWLSRLLQYRLLTRFLLSRIRADVEKFLFVSYETAHFLKEMYGLKDEEMEFYPLGGVIPNEEDRLNWRFEVRSRLGFKDTDTVLVHTGKLDSGKKTSLILRAFVACPGLKIRLILAGSLSDETSSEILYYVSSDDRIKYLGWVSGKELVKILCAGDLYVQPGTQSATLQMAMCCGLPIAVYPYPSHEPYVSGNGFYVKDEEDIKKMLLFVAKNPEMLADMAKKSLEIAKSLLDYKALAARLYA